MLKISLVALLLPALYADSASPEQIRVAVTRALAVVQIGATGFYKRQECFSCHDHGLPILAWQMARQHGVAVEESAAAQVAAKGLLHGPDISSIDRSVLDVMIVDPAMSDGWALIAADALGVRPNLVTAVLARRIATWQRPDGHFPTVDVRPPQSYSQVTATAVAVRALKLYMPPQLRKESDDRVARARDWLMAARPQSTEEFTYRLFGLYWAGASPAQSSPAAHDLLALQRPDGGWAELPHRSSDAYSTGEALMALQQSGALATTDAAWHKGLQYLLSTQDPQGSWQVRTRMLSPAGVSPPYFETGFPYGHDQMISADATCWAAMALLTALPKSSAISAPPPPAALTPQGLKPWMDTTLFGTAAELKTLLDEGLDSNSRTPEGTTLLMMAAADPAKVKLLLARGADVRARAKSGFTALMVAATYYGNAESVKQLLAAGAEARPGTGVMFNASPLFLAALSGDVNTFALLKSAGADANRKMMIIGIFPTSPLLAALAWPEAGPAEAALAAGGDIREKDQDGLTPLHWAVVNHHPAVVQALLKAGADVNAVDNHGYTPLHYATAIDFGDADTAALLLTAGASPKVKTKDGKTPLELSRDYPYLREAIERAGGK